MAEKRGHESDEIVEDYAKRAKLESHVATGSSPDSPEKEGETKYVVDTEFSEKEGGIECASNSCKKGGETETVKETCETSSSVDIIKPNDCSQKTDPNKQPAQNGSDPEYEGMQAESKPVEDSTEPCSSLDHCGSLQSCSTTESCDIIKAHPDFLDPLSYTKSDEFTSEIFKIQIHNLPKFGFNDLKKRLKSHLHLNPHKIKSDKRYVTYICFRNESDRDEALRKINGHIWKGKTLQAKIAAPVADPYLQKLHKEKADDCENMAKTPKDQAQREESQTLTVEDAEARLRANVSPLWETDYSQQLQMKTDKIRHVLEQVRKNSFVKNLFRNESSSNGLACELLPIIPSPSTTEYRNKNEFTVGYGLDGQIVVGFRYGLYKDGTTAVGDATNLGIAMPAAIPVVKSFREFVSKSKWLPFRQETASGHWQTLTVRTFHTGDVMAMVDFVPRKLEQSDIANVKLSLKDFYTTGEGKDVNITSFYFRITGSKGQNVKPSSELLFGESHVYETLLNLKFRISAEAFFQVNTAATAKLYALICDWCSISSSTTILDICCGTGTIGLSMAKNAKQVIGIEMCPQAVEDARVNASINGINNATFHCAKVEAVISKVMSSLQTSSSPTNDIIAIVDPPRAGLHKDVIKTLRKCTEIQHLVYVSCNPESATENFIDLIRPETGRLRGQPFKMVKATPVDLFPGTRHCELVILFMRSGLNADVDGLSPDVAGVATDVGDVTPSGVATDVGDATPSGVATDACESSQDAANGGNVPSDAGTPDINDDLPNAAG